MYRTIIDFWRAYFFFRNVTFVICAVHRTVDCIPYDTIEFLSVSPTVLPSVGPSDAMFSYYSDDVKTVFSSTRNSQGAIRETERQRDGEREGETRESS